MELFKQEKGFASGEGTLRNLLTRQDPNEIERELAIKDAKDRQLIDPSQRQESHFCSENWLHIIERSLVLENYEKLVDFLKSNLKDKILVDLGGGSPLFPHMRIFSEEMGVGIYVRVDNFTGSGIEPRESHESEKIKVVEIHSDMLTLVSQLEDDSVDFSINGIDDWVINSTKYQKALAREVSRATRPSGLILGVSSTILELMKHEQGLRPVSFGENYYGEHVFQKIND